MNTNVPKRYNGKCKTCKKAFSTFGVPEWASWSGPLREWVGGHRMIAFIGNAPYDNGTTSVNCCGC